MVDKVQRCKGYGAPIRPNATFYNNCGVVGAGPHEVIISYASSDKLVADAVCAKLEESNIRCWIAPRDILPSDNYAAAILDAIDGAKIMVLIFSAKADASPHVMREVEYAVRDGIPIIPFRIEDVKPSSALQYYIGPQHWLDALTPPLEAHILKLIETICLLLGKPFTVIAPTKRTVTPQSPQIPGQPRIKSQKMLALSVIIALVVCSTIVAGYHLSTSETSPTASPSTFSEKQVASNNLMTYRNTSLGVEFEYPKNWTAGKGQASPTNYYWIFVNRWDDNTTHMYFFREAKSFYDTGNDTTTILNKVNANIKYISTSSNFSNFTLIQNATPVTIAGVPAYEFRYSYTPMKDARLPTLLTKQIVFIRGDSLFAIEYKGSPIYYNRSLSAAEQIIDSFQFI